MVPLFMSDIINKNNSGPRTVSWGTPFKTGLSVLIPPGIITYWVMLVKNWKNHMPSLLVIPKSLSLCSNTP